MIRAAAKNYRDVAVVVSPADYEPVMEELRASGELSAATHWRLAKKAFRATADYDAAISARLELEDAPAGPLPPELNLRAPKAMDLRYGENPHQQAALYASPGRGIAGAEQLHGKELSYNNLVDLDACWQLALEFAGPAAAIIKHTNPCGCAGYAGGSVRQGSRMRPGVGVRECDRIQSRGGRGHGAGVGQALRGSGGGAGLLGRGFGDSEGQKESAPDAGRPGAGPHRAEIHLRRVPGAERR